MKQLQICLMSLLMVVMLTPNAFAYIGPGAGFAFLGSAFVFVITFFIAIGVIAFWPVRWLWKNLRGKKISKNAKTRRLVILGLDGFDPKLTKKFMSQGDLPHLKALSEKGGFRELATTFPSISPVAWSTFQTGVNPGAHNIFDFLTRDKRMYLPDLSSMSVDSPRKSFTFGKWRIPLTKPDIRILRKSQPFWKVLGKQGIFSNILRVPITCPAEPFEGNILSGMCAPDLKGSQGTFSFYSTEHAHDSERIGGTRLPISKKGNRLEGKLEGPLHPFLKEPTVMTVPFKVELKSKDEAVLEIKGDKTKLVLKTGEFTDWVRVEFKVMFGIKISGICRFYVKQMEPSFELYVSPVNIDPENPSMPISHPNFFSIYLSKLNGPYGTLGLMEDTWACNEKVLDDNAFLKQTYLTHDEREKMFFDGIEKTQEGVCVCVFDGSDRIQHIFWRYLEDDHPAPKDGTRYKSVIPEMYQKMDDLVGRTAAKLNEGDTFIVLSDHGFASFKRCVNVNTWLMEEGYLVLKNGKISEADHFQDVDWTKTKAFAVGLSGIFLNRIGRERYGIVDDQEAAHLKKEMIAKLRELKDPQNQQKAIRDVYDPDKIYSGIYSREAPDLLLGYEPGYRISWESVTGKMRSEIFEDNTRAWSGDHCIDATCVPGVFFSNRPIKKESPNMIDIAPTVLDLFDVKVPKYMEGEPIL